MQQPRRFNGRRRMKTADGHSIDEDSLLESDSEDDVSPAFNECRLDAYYKLRNEADIAACCEWMNNVRRLNGCKISPLDMDITNGIMMFETLCILVPELFSPHPANLDIANRAFSERTLQNDGPNITFDPASPPASRPTSTNASSSVLKSFQGANVASACGLNRKLDIEGKVKRNNMRLLVMKMENFEWYDFYGTGKSVGTMEFTTLDPWLLPYFVFAMGHHGNKRGVSLKAISEIEDDHVLHILQNAMGKALTGFATVLPSKLTQEPHPRNNPEDPLDPNFVKPPSIWEQTVMKFEAEQRRKQTEQEKKPDIPEASADVKQSDVKTNREQDNSPQKYDESIVDKRGQHEPQKAVVLETTAESDEEVIDLITERSTVEIRSYSSKTSDHEHVQKESGTNKSDESGARVEGIVEQPSRGSKSQSSSIRSGNAPAKKPLGKVGPPRRGPSRMFKPAPEQVSKQIDNERTGNQIESEPDMKPVVAKDKTVDGTESGSTSVGGKSITSEPKTSRTTSLNSYVSGEQEDTEKGKRKEVRSGRMSSDMTRVETLEAQLEQVIVELSEERGLRIELEAAMQLLETEKEIRERHSSKLVVLVNKLTKQKEEAYSENRRMFNELQEAKQCELKLLERLDELENRESEERCVREEYMARIERLEREKAKVDKDLGSARKQLLLAQERAEKRGVLRRTASRPGTVPRHSLNTLLPTSEEVVASGRGSGKLVVEREQLMQSRRERNAAKKLAGMESARSKAATVRSKR